MFVVCNGTATHYAYILVVESNIVEGSTATRDMSLVRLIKAWTALILQVDFKRYKCLPYKDLR
jgi:hypothetical protein